MLIISSCLALNLSYLGCCTLSLSHHCGNNGCFCHQNCHISNNCCDDKADIGCYPPSSSSLTVSPTPINKFGKTISEALHFIIIIIYVAKQLCIQQCTFPPTSKAKIVINVWI